MFRDVFLAFGEHKEKFNYLKLEEDIERLEREFQDKIPSELVAEYNSVLDGRRYYHIIKELELIKFTIKYKNTKKKK